MIDDLLSATESYDEALILSSIEPIIEEVVEEEEPTSERTGIYFI